jgi:hypothetical protein
MNDLPKIVLMELLQNERFARKAMLANGSSGQFLGQSGVATLHNLGENCSDGPFRNRAKV